ncbi:uncharacterized protein LOC132062737 [Lycium ferocissimum]|uniref:uncharacterized protein LOC132062737 n=1 Tax=Lycium ferocissimum TaxID=112874 RepID=UPI002814DE8B|nr:uncharacterized protein LOC132062737 [Lycium ferocissimum]
MSLNSKRVAYFEKKLTKSYVENDDFILPSNILEFLPDTDNEAVVIFERGAYNMKYKVGAHTRLYQGWKEFIDANRLRTRDVLCFKACDAANDRIAFLINKKQEIIEIA